MDFDPYCGSFVYASSGDCPSHESLAAQFGRLGRASIERHVADCSACRRVIVNIARTDRVDRTVASDTPIRIGRYVATRRLGAGAMGTVYAAYDEDLDRKVAIKFLRPSITAEEGTPRLLREAKALARVSHDNVVRVYEAGAIDGLPFIAMELVDGPTLGTWLGRPERRSWRETLALFEAIGRGLDAAHRAGVVHRDFKPDNVLLAHEGVPKVADFGLAAVPSGLDTAPARALVGTPRYMAPEQFEDGVADARSDQFSFCVVLYQALYGTPPFEGQTLEHLIRNVSRGEISRPPPDHRVPRAIHVVLLRGLATQPSERWSSMTALLEALQHARSVHRRWLAAAGGAGLGIGLAMLGSASWIAEHERIAACEGEGEAIARVWNDEAAADLRAQMSRARMSHAVGTAERVSSWLDAHARAWSDAATGACLRHTVHEDWAADTYARARWCLQERALELEALVGRLGTVDEAAVIEHAIAAAARLTPLAGCIDEDDLARQSEIPIEVRDRLTALQSELSQATVLSNTGAVEQAVTASTTALRHAEEIGWSPAIAAAKYELGSSLMAAGQYAEAEEVLEGAYFEAVKAGRADLAADAAGQLTRLVGDLRERHADGLRWARHAELQLAELGPPGDLRRASQLTHEATVYQAMAEYGRAQALFEESMMLRERSLGPDHPDVGANADHLGGVLVQLGEYDAAIAQFERALAMAETTFGPDHPSVAGTRTNLGMAYSAKGDLARARHHHERSVRVFERAVGPEHPELARALNNLAVSLQEDGDLEGAAAMYRRALSIKERALGPAHSSLAATLGNLSVVLDSLGSSQEAGALLERQLEIQEQSLGPDHPALARTLSNLASRVRPTDPAEAKRLLQRAKAILERKVGPDHADLAIIMMNLGNAHQALGEYEDAKPLYRRALSIFEQSLGAEHPYVVSTLTVLGSVHRRTGELDEAAAAYRRALEIVERSGEGRPMDASGTLLGLADIERMRHRSREALVLAERGLAIREASGNGFPLAEARFYVARLLGETRGDRKRAIELATAALETFEASGSASRGWLADARRWLRLHRSTP